MKTTNHNHARAVLLAVITAYTLLLPTHAANARQTPSRTTDKPSASRQARRVWLKGVTYSIPKKRLGRLLREFPALSVATRAGATLDAAETAALIDLLPRAEKRGLVNIEGRSVLVVDEGKEAFLSTGFQIAARVYPAPAANMTPLIIFDASHSITLSPAVGPERDGRASLDVKVKIEQSNVETPQGDRAAKRLRIQSVTTTVNIPDGGAAVLEGTNTRGRRTYFAVKATLVDDAAAYNRDSRKQ